jgi:hypothetical protein
LIEQPKKLELIKPANDEPVSLFERLKQKKSTTTATLPIREEYKEIEAVPTQRAQRNVPKKVYAIGSDSEQDVDEIDEESEEEKPAPKKRAPPKKKTAPTSVATTAIVPVSPPVKGTKRAQKSSAATTMDVAAYSPAVPTPKPTKKARTKKGVDEDTKPVPTKKVTATKPAPASKKPVSRKLESDEEFDAPTVKLSPKPTRQRAVTNYAKYYSEDEEEDEDSFVVNEDESEFSDD